MKQHLAILGVSGYAGSGKDTVADYLVEKHGFMKVALADPLKRFAMNVFGFTEDQLWGPSHMRNAVDSRFSHLDSPAWETAHHRMIDDGCAESFIQEVMPDERISTQSEALSALNNWFFWLKEAHGTQLSPRIVLQTLGTEWGRNSVGIDCWVSAMLRTARKLLHFQAAEYSYDRRYGLFPVKSGSQAVVKGVVVSDIRFQNEFEQIHGAGGAVIRVIRPDTDGNAATLGISGHASEAHDYSLDNFDFILNNNQSVSQLYESLDTYITVFKLTHH